MKRTLVPTTMGLIVLVAGGGLYIGHRRDAQLAADAASHAAVLRAIDEAMAEQHRLAQELRDRGDAGAHGLRGVASDGDAAATSR